MQRNDLLNSHSIKNGNQRGKSRLLDKNRSLSRLDFNDMFVIPNIFLRILGLSKIYAALEDDEENENDVISPIISTAVGLGLLGLINNFVYQRNNGVHGALEIMPTILSAFIAWFGGILLYASSKKIKGLLGDMKASWTEAWIENTDPILIGKAKRSIFCTLYYSLFIIALGGFYVVVPLVRMIQKFTSAQDDQCFDVNITVLPMRYPFSINTLPIYILTVMYEVSCIFILAISYLIVDTLFLQLTTIVCLLLQNAGKKFRDVTLDYNIDKGDQSLLREIHHIGKQHSQLLSYCRRIEETFNPIIYLIILSTSANLCVCVIDLESSLSELELAHAATLVMHFAVVVMQPLIYCNYAEGISQQTNNIATMIYACQWSDKNKKFKRIVLLIMMRSQRNYKFGEYGLFKVDRHLLTQLARTAANFFMLLRKANT
ncbi:uncharacterized protein LOC135169963 isoform X2 [Diachasmimorpha longicaudata]